MDSCEKCYNHGKLVTPSYSDIKTHTIYIQIQDCDKCRTQQYMKEIKSEPWDLFQKEFFSPDAISKIKTVLNKYNDILNKETK